MEGSDVTTIAILQARMTSTRMPGKVLAPLHGQPMIVRQLERLRRATTLHGVVVATSTDPSDDALVEALALARPLIGDVPMVRGPLDDVLGRFLLAMQTHPGDVVVRLTADCPLASPEVIDRVVTAFYASGADYVSNTMKATYPDGLDIEVVRASVLAEVAAEATDPHEREHVTLGVYRRHDRYRIENVAGDRDLSELRWTVDTPEDHAFVADVYDALYPSDPTFDLDDILEWLRQHPERSRTVADGVRNAALTGLDTGAMQ
jgi:spore coat polysaccharide biosynthesis protein SpsF